ncbi:MAG: hypothetical protein ACAI44_30980 [Candidatus Sericytochromatia bacterium]
MKSGICPKCSQSDVYFCHGSKYASEQVALNEAFFGKATAPDKYVCGSCGYLEYYLQAQEALKFVSSNWEKIHSI